MTEPVAIEPDTKDWTWVLGQTCAECGFTASDFAGPAIAGRVAVLTDPWREVLARPDAAERPTPSTWSALEYACHVRDVCRVFTERVDWMLRKDNPQFPNWDQDAAAQASRYHEQDPAEVASELRDAAVDARDAFAAVQGEEWQRTGVRSNGSAFTVETLGQYFLHDLAHHLVDVGADTGGA
jgi:DinB superfamily